MSEMNRRDLCLAAGAFAALGGLLSQANAQQETHGEGSGAAIDLSKSQVFHFDQMTVQQHANGGWGRPVCHGTLPTGEFVEVHETMLPRARCRIRPTSTATRSSFSSARATSSIGAKMASTCPPAPATSSSPPQTRCTA